MTDSSTNQSTPFFQIQRVYLKGVSLELPHAPQIFLEPGELTLDVRLTHTTQELNAGLYEVLLRGTLTGKLGDKVVYLLEVEQAGIFEIRNVPQPDLGVVLDVNCPAILTPYLRSNVGDTLQRASLPPFLLAEINWFQGYQERQKANEAAALSTVH